MMVSLFPLKTQENNLKQINTIYLGEPITRVLKEPRTRHDGKEIAEL